MISLLAVIISIIILYHKLLLIEKSELLYLVGELAVNALSKRFIHFAESKSE